MVAGEHSNVTSIEARRRAVSAAAGVGVAIVAVCFLTLFAVWSAVAAPSIGADGGVERDWGPTVLYAAYATAIALVVIYLVGVPIGLLVERTMRGRTIVRSTIYLLVGAALGTGVGVMFVGWTPWLTVIGAVIAVGTGACVAWTRRLPPQRARRLSVWAPVGVAVSLGLVWVLTFTGALVDLGSEETIQESDT